MDDRMWRTQGKAVAVACFARQNYTFRSWDSPRCTCLLATTRSARLRAGGPATATTTITSTTARPWLWFRHFYVGWVWPLTWTQFCYIGRYTTVLMLTEHFCLSVSVCRTVEAANSNPRKSLMLQRTTVEFKSGFNYTFPNGKRETRSRWQGESMDGHKIIILSGNTFLFSNIHDATVIWCTVVLQPNPFKIDLPKARPHTPAVVSRQSCE